MIVAVALLWDRAVDLTDLGILVVMYLLTGTGITIGFHRLLTHRLAWNVVRITTERRRQKTRAAVRA